MIVLNIIFIVTCYPILFLMYFMFRNAKDKNGWCFGATLSKELRSDSAVEAINAEYHKTFKITTIVLAIIPFTTFFVSHESIGFTIWMIWICVICFYPMILFARANGQIQELKKERGWSQQIDVNYTDLKIAAVSRKVSFVTFLPVFIMNIIPVILSFILFSEIGYDAFRVCIIVFAVTIILFYVSAVWTDKQKISIICEDSDTNMNFARAKKQLWKKFWLVCAWIHTAFTWFVLLTMFFRENGMSMILWGTVIYGVVIIFVTSWLIKKIYAINNKYEKKKTIANASDDDRYWPYGLMYYNPKDTHVMVENRMGTGTALNMATGIGKGAYIFSALCMLLIPFSCIWLLMLEFTPISTKVVDDTIVCSHLRVEYEIPLDEIEEYSVLTERPKMMKVMGTGMDNLLCGTFDIYREGKLEAFLNPQNDLFIKIVTEDEIYYISGVDDEATQEIINYLEK